MQLIERNRMPECLLRLNISRGITARGYSPKNAVRPAVVLTLHPAPVLDDEGGRLAGASSRLLIACRPTIR